MEILVTQRNNEKAKRTTASAAVVRAQTRNAGSNWRKW